MVRWTGISLPNALTNHQGGTRSPITTQSPTPVRPNYSHQYWRWSEGEGWRWSGAAEGERQQKGKMLKMMMMMMMMWWWWDDDDEMMMMRWWWCDDDDVMMMMWWWWWWWGMECEEEGWSRCAKWWWWVSWEIPRMDHLLSRPIWRSSTPGRSCQEAV